MTHDDDHPAHRAPSRETARQVIGFFAWLFLLFAAFFLVGGSWYLLEIASDSFGPGTVSSVSPRRGFDEFRMEEGGVGLFPTTVLTEAPRDGAQLQPGDQVAKEQWSLVYWLNGQPLGGPRLALKQLAGWHILGPVLLFVALQAVHRALYNRFASVQDAISSLMQERLRERR